MVSAATLKMQSNALEDRVGTYNVAKNLASTSQEQSHREQETSFEVTFDGLTDPYNPKSKSTATRWLICIIICTSSLCVTCASSIYSSIYTQVMPKFGVSRIVSTLGISFYVVGLGLGTIILAPLSEFYGRRVVYIFSFGAFFMWLIPCAVAQNIETMLVSRFFDGFSGSAFLSVSGGTIGDLFLPYELSAPMMLLTASPFLGPELGPLLGGFANQYADWRWTFYLLLIWAGLQLILIVCFVPETHLPILLKRKARTTRKDSGNEAWYAPIEKNEKSVLRTVAWSCLRPLQLTILEPMVLSLGVLSAILLGIIYLFFGVYPLVFGRNHDFTLSQTGLAFLGLLIGIVIGVLSDLLWRKNYQRVTSKHIARKEDRHHDQPMRPDPEYRLIPTIFGACLIPVSLFGFGWTTYSSSYPLYAASALAANSLMRNCFAAAFPLFGVQLYNALGYQWASSLLGFLGLAMAPFPFLLYKYGSHLRARSRFAS
ncbi:major facilitator superfamily domain-containing protein [Cadophora sp. MPI-SDFR-AT-0126]|nr:major facilitator superfamily domain-containing protein [Leotiomycetes sp. MPI-SDFR-AT-0126]